MYRCITTLRGFAVDLDSFRGLDIEVWEELVQWFKICFLTSENEVQETIQKRYPQAVVYHFPLFKRYLAPSPIMHMDILKKMQIQGTELVYISHDMEFVKRAMDFFGGTVLIARKIEYEAISASADIICPDIPYLVKLLKNRADKFVGESSISPYGNHKGLMVPTNFQVDDKVITLYVLGRYFGYTHYMTQKHPYSSAIYLNKKEGTRSYGVYQEDFCGLYLMGSQYINNQFSLDCICAVPPHKGCKNRFLQTLETIAEKLEIENIENHFWCTKEYPKQRGGSYVDRQENIVGVFSYDGNLTGKTVLIIDDVVTTGATLREGIRELYKAGAKCVIALVLGVNQLGKKYWSSIQPQVLCPQCAYPMTLLINSKNKNFFYKCMQCQKSINYEEGWDILCRKINSENISSELEESL